MLGHQRLHLLHRVGGFVGVAALHHGHQLLDLGQNAFVSHHASRLPKRWMQVMHRSTRCWAQCWLMTFLAAFLAITHRSRAVI
ncbi:hypothetical protein D3C84_1149550 [compost metagenome]